MIPGDPRWQMAEALINAGAHHVKDQSVDDPSATVFLVFLAEIERNCITLMETREGWLIAVHMMVDETEIFQVINVMNGVKRAIAVYEASKDGVK